MNGTKCTIEEFDDSVITINVKATETYKSLQRRIDKAIEYIEQNTTETDEDYRFCMKLLEILKGE